MIFPTSSNKKHILSSDTRHHATECVPLQLELIFTDFLPNYFSIIGFMPSHIYNNNIIRLQPTEIILSYKWCSAFLQPKRSCYSFPPSCFTATSTISNHCHHLRELQILSFLEDISLSCTQLERIPTTLEALGVMVLPTFTPVNVKIATFSSSLYQVLPSSFCSLEAVHWPPSMCYFSQLYFFFACCNTFCLTILPLFVLSFAVSYCCLVSFLVIQSELYFLYFFYQSCTKVLFYILHVSKETVKRIVRVWEIER